MHFKFAALSLLALATSMVSGASLQRREDPKTITVLVGNGNLTYIPNEVTANVGDTVQFQWTIGFHTVTQAVGVDAACVKNPDGFAASGNQSAPFSWSIVVNDTKPIWFYCNIPTHCQKGMFGVINGAPGAVLKANTDPMAISASTSESKSSDSKSENNDSMDDMDDEDCDDSEDDDMDSDSMDSDDDMDSMDDEEDCEDDDM